MPEGRGGVEVTRGTPGVVLAQRRMTQRRLRGAARGHSVTRHVRRLQAMAAGWGRPPLPKAVAPPNSPLEEALTPPPRHTHTLP